MKRIICLLLALFMIFPLTLGFVSCGDEEESGSSGSYTVYVSKSGGKIHKSPTCSGMLYYYTMTYKEAVNKGYSKCSKCY